MKKATFVAALLGLALLGGGCLQTTQTWTIYTDGSGKLTIRTVLKTEKPGVAANVPGSPSFENVIPVSSRVEPAGDPGHVCVVQECYFEDFNKVTYKKKPVGSFARTSEGGYEARLFKESTGRALPGGEPGKDGKPAMDPTTVMKMVAAQMKGLVYRMEIRMPGELTNTNCVASEDKRTAVLEVTEKTLLDDKTREAVTKLDCLQAICAPPTAAMAAEMGSFHDALSKAKEAHANDVGAKSMEDLLKEDEERRKAAEEAEGGEKDKDDDK